MCRERQVWSRDGREFSLNGSQMMAVDIETDPTFRPGTPQQLFDGGFQTGVGRVPVYDVTADGQRFLMVQNAASADGAAPQHLDLVGSARTVELTSRPSGDAANRLYRRMGFEPRDTNVYRYTIGEARAVSTTLRQPDSAFTVAAPRCERARSIDDRG